MTHLAVLTVLDGGAVAANIRLRNGSGHGVGWPHRGTGTGIRRTVDGPGSSAAVEAKSTSENSTAPNQPQRGPHSASRAQARALWRRLKRHRRTRLGATLPMPCGPHLNITVSTRGSNE